MHDNARFSPNKIKFIEWLATPKFKREPETQEAFAGEIGVNPSTLYRWKQDEAIRDAATQRAREFLHSELPDIYGALGLAAKQGSYQHIKLALELTGEYAERHEITGKDGKAIDIRIEYANTDADAS